MRFTCKIPQTFVRASDLTPLEKSPTVLYGQTGVVHEMTKLSPLPSTQCDKRLIRFTLRSFYYRCLMVFLV